MAHKDHKLWTRGNASNWIQKLNSITPFGSAASNFFTISSNDTRYVWNAYPSNSNVIQRWLRNVKWSIIWIIFNFFSLSFFLNSSRIFISIIPCLWNRALFRIILTATKLPVLKSVALTTEPKDPLKHVHIIYRFI